MFSFKPILKLFGMETGKSYTFKYEGDLEYIDANTLLISQINFIQALTEIQESFYPEVRLDIKIKPLPKGSFQMELLMGFKEITDLFKHAIEAMGLMPIRDIFETLTKIIEVKKFLGGEKPTKLVIKDNTVEIFKIDNSTHTVNQKIYNFYLQSPTTDEALRKVFTMVESDEEIKGVQIAETGKTEKIMDVKREAFAALAKPSELTDEKTEIVNHQNAIMSVFRVVFGEGIWQFYYDGHKISAVIKDLIFREKVKLGEPFASGDVMEVDLTIHRVFDITANTFINRTYEITKVHRHTPRAEQSHIEFND